MFELFKMRRPQLALVQNVRRQRAQGLVEFALILPVLLLVMLGIMEAGRMLAIYSSISSAARQAARYGSVGGDSGNGQAYFLDCAGMRRRAQSTSLLQPLANADINIAYDRGRITDTIGLCATNAITPTLSEDIHDGDRVVISITATYRPIVPIVPLPAMPMTFVAAHTIFTLIVGPTPTPRPNPDLTITKSGFPNPVQPGSTALTYRMLVSNVGGVEANNLVVTDTLPASITPGTVILPAAPSSPNGGWTCGRANLVVTCTMPFLGAGNVAPSIDLHVTAPITPGDITNVARVAYSQTDPQPTNNVATATTTVLTAVDLELHKFDLIDPVGAGTPITYALTVKNNGSVAATLLIVTDTLPANTTFVSAHGPAGDFTWACNPSLPTLVCTRTSPPSTALAVGSTAPTITVVLLAPLPGLVPVSGYITNQASASAQLMDPFPDNSTNIAVTTTVTTAADMLLLKFGPATADSDSLYQYTLRATNNGPSVATNVHIVDTVPAAIQLVTAGPGWTCATSGSTLTCDYGSNLAAGATASDIVVTVKAPNVNAALSNTASVSSAQPDAQPLNNTATVTTTVNNCHHNEVALDHSTLTASPTDVYADNASTSRVLVTLRDACDNILSSPPHDLQNVTLSSARGGLDTITPLAPTGNGQYLFDVKSGTSGTSTYSATATNSVNGTTVNLSATAQVNYYGCAETHEHPLAGSLNFLHLDVTNSSGLPRRLTGVNLIWPQSGGRKVHSITLQATTLWSGNSNNNPFVIPSGGLDWIAGTDAARTIASGAGTQALKINFSYSIAQGEDYKLVTTWDDGSGARVCTFTNDPIRH